MLTTCNAMVMVIVIMAVSAGALWLAYCVFKKCNHGWPKRRPWK